MILLGSQHHSFSMLNTSSFNAHYEHAMQRVECSDDQRLPTASTCFNILKLPTYSSSKIMKEKLLQSIRARAGFDLS